MFLVIANQMLERWNDPKILHARAVACRRIPREYWILRKRFKPTSTQWPPLDIDSRAQKYVCAFGLAFRCEETAEFEDKVCVKRCAERCSARETGGGDAIEVARAASTVRAVSDSDRRDAESWNREGVPGIGTCIRRRVSCAAINQACGV